ncbi:hypothetical protein PSEUDO8O_30471 [Pseudomonas sp. 8O]|nr:hypothetical protein PSEUDO8O_30471 [Pseudomonas sp. 8O]
MAPVSFVRGSKGEDQSQKRHQDDQDQPDQGVEAAGANDASATQVHRGIVFQVLIDTAFGFLLVVSQVLAQQVDGCLTLIGMHELAYCGWKFVHGAVCLSGWRGQGHNCDPVSAFFRAQCERLRFNSTPREWKRFARVMDEPKCLSLFFTHSCLFFGFLRRGLRLRAYLTNGITFITCDYFTVHM